MPRRDPAITSTIMARVPKKDTWPELRVRSLLWQRGFRYRVHYRKLRGSPDIVFVGKRVAIFIDGDFWHGNAWQLRGLANLAELFPTNTEWWVKKIMRNMQRDQETSLFLKDQGWTVLRFWESEIERDHLGVLEKITTTLSRA